LRKPWIKGAFVSVLVVLGLFVVPQARAGADAPRGLAADNPSFPFGEQQAITDALVREISPAMVEVVGYDSSGNPVAVEAGFFVSATGELITCRHILMSAARAEILTSDGNRYPITGVVGEDKYGDLIRLSVDAGGRAFPFLRIAPEGLERKAGAVMVAPDPTKSVSGTAFTFVSIPAFGSTTRLSAASPDFLPGSPLVNTRGEVAAVAIRSTATSRRWRILAFPASRITTMEPQRAEAFSEWASRNSGTWSGSPDSEVSEAILDLSGLDQAGAESHLSTAMKARPDDPLIWLLHGYSVATGDWKVEGKYAEAAKDFQEAIGLKPDFAEAHLWLGIMWGNLKKWPDMTSEFNEYVRLCGGTAVAYREIGVEYWGFEQHEEAIDKLRGSARLDPAETRTYYDLAGVYHDVGRYPDEIVAYENGIRVSADKADGYYRLAQAYHGLGRHAEEFKAYKECVRLSPQSPAAHAALGRVYFAFGKLDDAAKEFAAAVRLNPDSQQVYSLLADTYHRLGQTQQEAATREQFVHLNPKSGEAHCELGLMYLERHRYSDAAGELEESIKLRTLYVVRAHYGLARSYAKLGRYADAIPEYKIALSINTSPEIHYYLGVAYAKTGNKEAARKEYEFLKFVDADKAERLLKMTTQSSDADEDLPEMTSRALAATVVPAVVQVVARDSAGNPTVTGYGFFVNADGDVVTNRHILFGADSATVQTYDGKEYPVAGVVGEDKYGDLVLLAVSGGSGAFPFLALAQKPLRESEFYFAIGTPFGFDATTPDSAALEPSNVAGFGSLLANVDPVSYGASGSPILDMSGRVVALVESFTSKGRTYAYVIPPSRLSSLKRMPPVPLAEWCAAHSADWLSTPEGEYAQGIACMESWTNDAALAHFRVAAKKEPTDALIRLAIGLCLAGRGDSGAAAKAYEEAVRANPNDPQPHIILAATLAQLNRFDDAVSEAKEAVRLAPGDAEARGLLGIIYALQDKYAEAVPQLEEAVRLAPEKGIWHGSLGIAYAGLDRWNDAVNEFQEGAALNPRDSEMLAALGNAYFVLGQYDNAISVLEQAVPLLEIHDIARRLVGEIGLPSIGLGLADVRLTLGRAYLKQGNKDEALKEYEALTEIDKEKAEALRKEIG